MSLSRDELMLKGDGDQNDAPTKLAHIVPANDAKTFYDKDDLI